MKKKIIWTVFLTTILFTVSFRCPLCHAEPPVTAVLGALEEEMEIIDAQLTNKETLVVEGIKFSIGKINGRKVVVARTGVGKVNAAMTATLLIEHFKPSEIISTGVAGAINPELLPGDMIIATKTAQHDLGTLDENGMVSRGIKNPMTGEKNPMFFPANVRLIDIADTAARGLKLNPMKSGQQRRFPRIAKGVIVSGDVFVSSKAKKEQLRKDFHADAVEMEGAAEAQICWQQGVAFIAIRSISDMATTNASNDFGKIHRASADLSGQLVLEIIKQIQERPRW